MRGAPVPTRAEGGDNESEALVEVVDRHGSVEVLFSQQLSVDYWQQAHDGRTRACHTSHEYYYPCNNGVNVEVYAQLNNEKLIITETK